MLTPISEALSRLGADLNRIDSSLTRGGRRRKNIPLTIEEREKRANIAMGFTAATTWGALFFPPAAGGTVVGIIALGKELTTIDKLNAQITARQRLKQF